jgi:hypothetical protein
MLLIKTHWKQNALKVRRSAQLPPWRNCTPHNHQGAVFTTKAASPNPLSLDALPLSTAPLRAAFVGLAVERLRDDFLSPIFSIF